MDLAFTPQEQQFRAEIRAWVADNLPKEVAHKVHNALHLTREDMQGWARILGRKGWLGHAWPREFGGPGWNSVQRHLFEEECALAGAPRVVPFGPVIRAVAWSATRGEAVSEGWTMKQPEPPKMAKGLLGAWSVTPLRRSSSSTVFRGVGSSDDAEPIATAMKRNGTTTRKRNIPANTPSIVRKNCFMAREVVRSTGRVVATTNHRAADLSVK
jgi:hypothetical protein